MEKKTDYSKMSYQELENEINQILSNLQDDGLSLDEQIKIGEKGQKVLAEMGKRLDALKEKSIRFLHLRPKDQTRNNG